MKKYFYAEGKNTVGPVELDELISKKLPKETLIWHEGLSNWTAAVNIPEIAESFLQMPPPLPLEETVRVTNTEQKVKKRSSKNYIFIIGLIFLVSLSTLGYKFWSSSKKETPLTVQTPTVTNQPSIDNQANSQSGSIDAKGIALRKFDEYSPKIEASKDAAIGSSEAYTGDLNHDGLEDVIVFFVLSPKEGGNALMGQGIAVYVNEGTDMKVIAGFEPDYIFRVEGINNNKIHIVRLDYAENDNPGWPSIETHKYLILNGNRLQESNTF